MRRPLEPGQTLQLPVRLRGIAGRPRVPQHRGHIRVQMLREVAQNVAPFMELTSLDRREWPVGLEFRIRSLNRGLGHHCVAPEF